MATVGKGVTAIGPVRLRNEDAFLADDSLGLYAVADGMGGHPGGDVASRVAIATLQSAVEEGLPAVPRSSGHALENLLREAVQEANRAILAMAARTPRLEGMGTTLTAVLIGHDAAAFAHVGDSRLYAIDRRRAVQITHDHTLLADLRSRFPGVDTWPAAQGMANVLSRALGVAREVDVEAGPLRLFPGDCLFLCSDGVVKGLDDPKRLMTALEGDAEGAARLAVAEALAAGSTDNVTAVVVRVGHTPAQAALADAITAPITAPMEVTGLQ